MLLARWLRDPVIPYGGDNPRASEFSVDSTAAAEGLSSPDRALDEVTAAVTAAHISASRIASAAVDVPAEPEEAFSALGNLVGSPANGVLLLEGGKPLAWAGQIRSRPVDTPPGTAVTFDEFYVTLHVTAEKGARRAVASVLIHAEPPADDIAQALDEPVRAGETIESFTFLPAADSAQGRLIRTTGGAPLLTVDAAGISPEQERFAARAVARARGVVLLGLLVFFMIGAGWTDRRKLARRLFTLLAAFTAVALVPWSGFSNFSRAFDPAYFYSPLAGPLTANAGAFAMSASLFLLAVIAVVRGRRVPIHPIVAATGAVALAVAGPLFARAAAKGIVLPLWGSTARLWLQWEVPIFLALFALWLAAFWLAAAALRRRAMIQLRAAALIAVLSGAVATFLVWNSTTEQRLQLAMRDVAGLERVDGDASLLLARFGAQLAAFDSLGTRADLLKRYAVSDLASAQVQVALASWDDDGTQLGSLDLAPLTYDAVELARLVVEADAAQGPLLTQVLGPTGRQLMLVVPHRGGGVTTVVASPRTRLVARDPYSALLGFQQPDVTEPPYSLTLAATASPGTARTGTMTWRRIGNEWHGDELITTSGGLARAHVEVDVRAPGTRLVRAVLIIILDIAIAGILWALGTMAEGGFFRWVRRRASRWWRSYRGRLTIALFTFFVVPAVAFAAWSYQRLRGDDREVRELLVRETLHAAAGENPASARADGAGGETPLFLYSSAMLTSSSDSLYELIAPAGRMLPSSVHMAIGQGEELTASWNQRISGSRILWGFRSATGTPEDWVLAAPARRDEIVLDRRRRDITTLVLFATAVGGIAAFWLSGIAARVLARDLELSRLEVARAERVIAWGEMARQVAHEIKNPLTPIRLGIQHLQRARSDKRIDFDRVLDENATRILAEIDRLDEIARAFSRYGSAPSDLPPAEPVDVASILRDVIGLERMGIGGVDWQMRGADNPVMALARAEDLREVLLNVFENARLARARNVLVTLSRTPAHVRIEIVDDGAGIPSTSLPRVFEPHFSTRTGGSGLGLAISRRLIESWGGSIDLLSEEGRGAKVEIALRTEAA